MTARFYADLPLRTGASFSLPDQAARHVQVLRMQPGEKITLFNGLAQDADAESGLRSEEGEFEATIDRMGRNDVEVTIGAYTPTAREAPRAVHLAIGMPANDRMDWLVEKATELGVASIQPLMAERSVLRLRGERAEKKLAHWRGIAIAASEQCGRNRPPVIHEAATLAAWLGGSNRADARDAAGVSPAGALRLLLSLQPGTRPLLQALGELGEASETGEAGEASVPLTFLSGPEGGLSPQEESAARAAGFAPVTLGPRVLRAETAPLACLSLLLLLDRPGA